MSLGKYFCCKCLCMATFNVSFLVIGILIFQGDLNAYGGTIIAETE